MTDLLTDMQLALPLQEPQPLLAPCGRCTALVIVSWGTTRHEWHVSPKQYHQGKRLLVPATYYRPQRPTLEPQTHLPHVCPEVPDA